jgi:Cu/Ag efflux protein CusF
VIGLAFALGLGAAVALAQAPMAEGEITKVDEGAGKLVIRHGPIKKLDMDGMTMAFHVADPALLKNLKAGDKIRFDADKLNGKFTVIKIEKAQ